MEGLRVVTWNVLHRIHGEKWSKHVVSKFPDEATRVARITHEVSAWLAAGIDVVCLQEVSGDQLASLRGTGGQLFSHRYSRTPRHWRFWARPLADATEQLVTVTASANAKLVATQTFARDDGKGLLAIEVGGVRVVNTHLTFGKLGEAQLQQAAEVALAGGGPALVLGDLNADHGTVERTLAPRFTLAAASVSTRVEHSHRGGRIVDHIAAAGAVLESVSVVELEPLSDHLPVMATAR